MSVIDYLLLNLLCALPYILLLEGIKYADLLVGGGGMPPRSVQPYQNFASPLLVCVILFNTNI
jgi:hypothetical protein